jgi:hypothetical protein
VQGGNALTKSQGGGQIRGGIVVIGGICTILSDAEIGWQGRGRDRGHVADKDDTDRQSGENE